MFGYCAQLFREGSGQDAEMQVHSKSQQRRTELSLKKPFG